jgi:hypothetical protein
MGLWWYKVVTDAAESIDAVYYKLKSFIQNLLFKTGDIINVSRAVEKRFHFFSLSSLYYVVWFNIFFLFLAFLRHPVLFFDSFFFKLNLLGIFGYHIYYAFLSIFKDYSQNPLVSFIVSQIFMVCTVILVFALL